MIKTIAFKAVSIGLSALIVNACGGAASMRIEVDVYKGPLSNDVELQKGQLATILKSAPIIIDDTDGQLLDSMCRIGCVVDNATVATSPIPRASISPAQRDLRRFYPTYQQCTARGIPQRRARVEPKQGGPDKYIDWHYLTEAETISPLTGDPGNKYGSDQIRENIRNYNAPTSRFPETEGTTYRVCPIYERMRTQLYGIKCHFATNSGERELCFTGNTTPVPEYVSYSTGAKDALRFLDVVRLENIIDEIQQNIRELQEFELPAICGAPEGSKDEKETIKGWCEALRGSAQELRSSADSANNALETRNTNQDNQFKDQLRGVSQATQATLRLVQSSQNILDSFLQTQAPSQAAIDLAARLDALKNSINANISVPGQIDVLQTAIGALEADVSVTTLDARATQLGQVENALGAISAADTPTNPSTLGNVLAWSVELERELNAPGDTVLRQTLLSKQLERTQIDQASMRAQIAQTQLDGAREHLTTLVGHVDGLRRSQRSYDSERGKYEAERTRDNPTLAEISSVLGADKTPADEDVATALGQLKNFVTRARPHAKNPALLSSDWSGTGIEQQSILDALTTLEMRVDALLAPEVRDQALGDDIVQELQAFFTGDAPLANEYPVASLRDDSNTTYNTERTALRADLAWTAGNSMVSAEIRHFENMDERVLVANQVQSIIQKNLTNGLDANVLGQLSIARSNRTILEQHAKTLEEIGQTARESISAVDTAQRQNDLTAYRDATQIAGAFRVLSIAITFQFASVLPNEKRLRIDMLKTANMAAELSNQITARASALAEQANGRNRLNLATARYLRDSQTTDFLNSFQWLGATAGDNFNLPPGERAEVTRQLFDDDNWANVNESYASGAGDVTMAFIRDEIGNWNLKSFTSDPSKLVNAYGNLATTLVEKAASLATSGGGLQAVEQATSLLALTANAQAGTSANSNLRSGALISALELQSVRDDLVKRLETEREKVDFENNSAARARLRTACEEAQEEGAPASISDEDLIEGERCQKQRNIIQSAVKADAIAIAKEYEALISALQRVAVAVPSEGGS